MALAGSAEAQVTATTVTLKWTAPGDDGAVGLATAYDLRYSTAPIDSANFAAATRWTATPAPSAAGSAESVTITGLAPATTYYFAVKTADEVPNWSPLSNVVSVATLPAPDVVPPSPITDLRPGP